MATATLRPTSAWRGAGWTATGTNNDAQAAANLADNTDSTQVYNPNMGFGGSYAYLELGFGTIVVPAGAQIRQVRPAIRGSGDQASSRIGWRLWDHGGAGAMHSIDSFAFGTAWQTVYGAWRTRNYAGLPWTQTDVDAVGMLIAREADESGELRVTAAYIEVLYNERPTVTVTGPADDNAGAAGVQVTTTSKPLITWTYTDPENDAQERYQVKVFTAAQYGAAGFDPDTSAAAWDSGIVFSSDTSVTVGGILANNTTHRAYVKVSDVGAEGRSSLWAFREFTMAVPAPPVPSFAQPVVDVTNQEVDLSASSTGSPAPEFLRFEYRLADGVTWVPVRGADRVATTSGATQTASDREAPPNQGRTYRVLAGRVVAGQDILSSPSTLRSSANLTNDQWRLKDVIAGTSITLRPAAGEADLVETEPHGIFSPLGAGRRVVISDTLKGESIALSLIFLSGAAWDAFRAMRASGNTLLLVSPAMRQWYVRFVGDLAGTLFLIRGEERRRASADFVEVDRP